MLNPGTRLGPYEILGAIGAGGMGEVYRARDTRLNRTVATKVLPSGLTSDPDLRARFKREAEAVAALNHPHICTLYDIGQHEGIDFLVMEYLDGETLAERLRRGPVPIETLLIWALQVAEALEQAHNKGIVHRDLKPANVFVTTSDAIKVLDFGVAKFATLTPDTLAATMPLTNAGMAVGTAAYMSPEQARGEPIDPRSDVFSLGAVLYEAATGQPAFAGSTTAVIFEAILNRHVRPLRDLVTDAPPAFVTLVDRMLVKRPEDRPPHGGAVATALREIKKAADSGSRRSVAARVPSIAVLPFADMSPQKDQEYFCEGMAEELINALSKLQGLRVASRTSAFRFRGAEDIRKIGQQLGVETVLEGSVRTAGTHPNAQSPRVGGPGTRLRVTAQLTSVADGYQIWSDRYDRQMEDVFDIQDEIARAIVGALKVTLLGDVDAALVKRGTENVEAYHLCLKARHHWFKWTGEGFRKAMELFQQALAVDSQYPLAIFGLADCHIASACIGVERDPHECEAMFKMAVRLDPELAEAHAILGLVQGWWTWQWAAAERSFETAVRLAPRSAHVLSAYGLHLSVTNRIDDAIAQVARGVELDPLVPFWNMNLAQAYVAARRYAEAIRQADVALELAPTYTFAHGFRGLACAALGRVQEGVASLERAVNDSNAMPFAVGWLGFVLARAGRREEADVQLHTLLERARTTYVPGVSVAAIYAGLNDTPNALHWLERAYTQKAPYLSSYLRAMYIFDELRADPRFTDLVRRVFGETLQISNR